MGARSFFDFLREQRAGETEQDLTKALNKLVEHVTARGKKGTLTLTIEVAPIKEGLSGQVIVSDDVDLKLPKPHRESSLFYTTPENNLSRRDPRQADLELKPVVSAAPELKPVAPQESTNAG